MSDTVWFSHLPADISLNFYFHDPEKNLPYQQQADLFDAINEGETTDLSLLPRKMHLDEDRKFRRKALPRVFKVSCMYFSEEVTRVFQQFNTENIVFFPVDFYGHDGAPKLSETPYYGVAFTGNFDTVDLEEDGGRSAEVNEYDPTGPRRLGFDLEDGSVPILKDYNKHLDFWVDGRVRDCLFLSDRLHGALKKVGFERAFKAKRCKV